MKSIPPAWRWTLAALIVVLALVVAFWPREGRDTSPSGVSGNAPAAVSADQRAAAGLAPCPAGPPGRADASAGPLAAITLGCLADGRPMDLGHALAGRPAVVNLWASWCEPCARELPALQQYAERAAGAVTVLTAHSDPDEAAGLARLRDLNVHLPGVEDGGGRVRSAVGAPSALPVSVLVRADGSLAKLVVRPFDSVDDIARTVAADLGVAA